MLEGIVQIMGLSLNSSEGGTLAGKENTLSNCSIDQVGELLNKAGEMNFIFEAKPGSIYNCPAGYIFLERHVGLVSVLRWPRLAAADGEESRAHI